MRHFRKHKHKQPYCLLLFLSNKIDLCKKKLDENPGNVPLMGITLNDIGCCYFELKDYIQAIHFFRKVLDIKEIPDIY